MLDPKADGTKACGTSHLTPRTIRELSVAVPCDPRTLLRALNGKRVQSTRLVAIRRVLKTRGLLHLLPDGGEMRREVESPLVAGQGGVA